MLRVLLRGGGRVPARALARAPARWLATSPPKKGRAKSAVPKKPKSSPKGSGAKAATSEKEVYQRLTPHEHVLARPGMYIGSPEVVPKSMWLYDDEAQCMVWRSVQFNSGLYKIFDEILVNALDNRQRDPEGTRAIDVEIDEAGRVSVRNDGRGIPVRRHATEEQVTLYLTPSPNP
jgi:DNA topoisomerase-2